MFIVFMRASEQICIYEQVFNFSETKKFEHFKNILAIMIYIYIYIYVYIHDDDDDDDDDDGSARAALAVRSRP